MLAQYTCMRFVVVCPSVRQGPFGSEFPAICNHCELWRPELARPGNFVSNFFVFFWKMTPCGKVFKILFQKFSPPHRSTLLCSNVAKFVRQEIGEIVHYSRDQKKFRLLLKILILSLFISFKAFYVIIDSTTISMFCMILI